MNGVGLDAWSPSRGHAWGGLPSCVGNYQASRGAGGPLGAGIGNRRARTGLLRPAWALRGGYRARGRRRNGTGADAAPRPLRCPKWPFLEPAMDPIVLSGRRRSSTGPARSFVRSFVDSFGVGLEPRSLLRFHLLGKDSDRAPPGNQRFGSGTHQGGGAGPGPAMPRPVWTAAGPSPPGLPPPGAGQEKDFGAWLRR